MVNDNIIGRQRPDGYSSWNSAMDQAAGVAPAEFAAYTCNEEIVERFARSLGGENIRPSMLIAPSRLGSGVLRAQIPDNLAFTVTNGTSPNVNGSTRVGPNGLIETAKTNLVLQSAAFNVTWSAQSSTQVSANTTATTDPAGGNNADFIFCTASGTPVQGFNQFINVTESGTYTMSVFVKKAVNFDWFRLQFRDAAGIQYQAYYNIASGTLGTIDGGSTATISNYGNGWYRITHSRSTASGSLAMGVRLASADNQTNVNADGNSGTYAWGAQLEVGSSASEYIPTTTVARTRFAGVDVNFNVNANAPRLDYFGQSCPGLLVEPSAQNLALQSENFGTNWGLVNLLAFGSGSVLNTTATVDPYGNNSADLIVANVTVGQHRVDQSITHASGSYVFSVFLKAAGYSFARLRFGLDGAVFNLLNGNTSGVSAGIIASSQNLGNGWYRCIIGKAAAVANETILINMQQTVISNDFAGDGTSGIYVFGAQYEAGSIATSYIPTTTSAVTRNADVISASGVSGLIGQTEGTIYAEVDVRSSGAGSFISIDVGSGTDFIIISKLSNFTIVVQLRRANGSVVTIITSSAVSIGVHKIALAYTNGDYALYIDGNSGGTSTDSTNYPASTLTRCSLANTSYGIFNDRIRAAALYTTRLSNEQLMLLTSPTYYGDIADMSWSYYLNRDGGTVPSCLQTRNYQLLQV